MVLLQITLHILTFGDGRVYDLKSNARKTDWDHRPGMFVDWEVRGGVHSALRYVAHGIRGNTRLLLGGGVLFLA